MKIDTTHHLEDVFIASEATTQGFVIEIVSRKKRVPILRLTFSRNDLASRIAEIDELVKKTVDALAIAEPSTPLEAPQSESAEVPTGQVDDVVTVSEVTVEGQEYLRGAEMPAVDDHIDRRLRKAPRKPRK